MEEIVLPLSGWRVAVDAQPGGTMTFTMGPEAIPGLHPPRQLPTTAVGGHTFGYRRTGLLGLRKRYRVLVWGATPAEVQVSVPRRLRRPSSLQVYRVGSVFWVAETDMRIRTLRIGIAGPEDDCTIRRKPRWPRIHRRHSPDGVPG
jgi:hypothetical protein